MDREQEEMQFLGFFGIIKDSIKIIFTWRKIFSQIMLALVLRLSFIFSAYTEISDFLMEKIQPDQHALNGAKVDTPKYNKLLNPVTSDKLNLCLSRVIYHIFFLTFSLLSTPIVVHAIACVYTSRSICFGRVISVVPKVCKRLMITLMWSSLAVFIYIIYIVVTIAFCCLLFELIHSPAIGMTLGFIRLILFLFWLVCISVILDLAGVISVLQDIYGIQAMFKCTNHIKGKMWISIAINFLLTIGSMAIHKAIITSFSFSRSCLTSPPCIFTIRVYV